MDIQTSVQRIESYLDLDRKPVGIKFFRNREAFDAFEVDQRDRKVTYCNAVQLASKGKSMKLTKENQSCPNGAFALNFTDVPEPIANGMGRFKKGIYTDQETSRQINEDMVFMKEKTYGVAVMPLENYTTDPDVVIVVGSPFNIMRIIQGNGHFNGYTNNLRTVGLQAVCQDLTTYPYNTEDINISLLCPGTRLVADWVPDEIGVGIPFAKWYEIVEGVKQTINPFERNKNKEAIRKRLEEKGLDAGDLKFDENYDDGSYSGGKIDI